MSKPKYHVASFSGGKDSTAMVLHMIERGDPLDEVMFCDTTMEFPAMLRHVAKVKKIIEDAGIKFTTLRSEHDFEYLMLHHKPKRKKEELADKVGYSWPGPRSRWCTRALKKQVIDRHLQELRKRYDVVQCVGLAADEGYRLERKNNQGDDMRHPLSEWGWDEGKAMRYCHDKGYDWEGLYGIFNRVSCWCCPLQGISELRKLREHFPDLWHRLGELDAQTWRTLLKDYSVEQLERRFAFEDMLTAEGHSIKNKAFFADLKRLLTGEATAEELLQERKQKNG
jgi:3'-phosphoadenosine 5'-phosphosulfate sulfotransferase (PAPS reductase)/FAD synthetase